MEKSIIASNKNFIERHNVTIRVIDEISGKIVSEHTGHNNSTNSMLIGIAHYLAGDGIVNQGISMLSKYVPQYISLGTMGLDNQEADEYGLPAGIGYIKEFTEEEYQILAELQAVIDDLKNQLDALACKCYKQGCKECFERCINEELRNQIEELERQLEEAKQNYKDTYDEIYDKYEEEAFANYMKERPGYGADGYDEQLNNGRKYAGLGWAWSGYDIYQEYVEGSVISYKGKLYRAKESSTPNFERGQYFPFSTDKWEEVDEEYQPKGWEIISPSFPRELISYRDIVPETESEFPETVDLVLSALVSTGVLQQFREEDKDYIFITEAGLWSRKDFVSNSVNSYTNYGVNENGLLAGYRICPPNEENWYMVAKNIPQSIVDKYLEKHPEYADTDVEELKKIIAKENRNILKSQIIRVGRNQVVQIVWKIQIGTVDQFAKIEDLRKKYYDIDVIY